MVFNIKAAPTSVDVANLTPIPGPITVRTITFHLTHRTRTADVRIDINRASCNKITTVAKRANGYKGVSLLFIITVVFQSAGCRNG